MKEKDLTQLEAASGHTFKNLKLLEQALTHSSTKDERHPSNERLEFLGDAVLGLVVTEYLYRRFPDLDEGELTAVKSVVVSRDSLHKIAKDVGLKRYLNLGKGITKKRSVPASVLADAVEAFIGAVYLDRGYRAARRFVMEQVEPMVERARKKNASRNYKSLLQSYVQRKFGATPHYRLVTEEGPDHKKTFRLAAVVCERTFPCGEGKSKKIASQHAARNALKILQEEYGKMPGSPR